MEDITSTVRIRGGRLLIFSQSAHLGPAIAQRAEFLSSAWGRGIVGR
ncbi:hypothetical protein [Streptomyces sp. AC550_RSS872]|nr:hypothetical protein [Streptomyces sp. AC550_RSS872]